MSAGVIKVRIPFEGTVSAMGPGKADLLEAIDRTGSISAAAKAMNMSYKRAWDLVDVMNRCYQQPLVATATGGTHGGGAQVTAFGFDVLRRYRALQAKAEAAIAGELGDFMRLLK